MSVVAETPSPAAAAPPPAPASPARADRADVALAGAVAALIVAVAFVGGGGSSLAGVTAVQIGLTLLAAGLAIWALVRSPSRAPRHGALALALFAALAAWCAISIVWSVEPSASWREANLVLGYVAAFGGAIVLARLAPNRWAAVLAGTALGCVLVCAWALATKVFPGALDAAAQVARLREPFEYWNALAILGGLAVPILLWLGARREGPRRLRLAAAPALALVVTAIVLSQSRGAITAVAIGAVLWFALVPLRARALAVLAPALAGAALPLAVALTSDALSKDRQALGDRIAEGRLLGVAIVAMVALVWAASVFIDRRVRRQPPSAAVRRRAGIAAIAAAVLAAALAVVALATSSGGLGALTDPDAPLPAAGASRFGELSNARARYWRDAITVFSDHPWVGAGAGGYATARLRDRKDVIFVGHAHGFVPQTMADLGIVGLALSLALLAAWLAAALRAIAPRARGGDPVRRAALATMLAAATTFGVHSFLDWTWYAPAPVVAALLLAGFLAGAGPPRGAAAPSRVRGPVSRRHALQAASIAILAVAVSWAMWQPQRSAQAVDAAYAAADARDVPLAFAEAQRAQDADPLAVEPLFATAAIAEGAGLPVVAARSYQEAVRLQPANPATWFEYGRFLFAKRKQVALGLAAMRAGIYLDPRNPAKLGFYGWALRLAAAKDPRLARAFALKRPPR